MWDHRPISHPWSLLLPLSTLLPHLTGLRLEQLAVYDHAVLLSLRVACRSAPCPRCQRPSRHLHSHYYRTFADLPLGGRPVQLKVRVRRFRCRIPTCPQRIFAERLPRLGAVRARRTQLQRTVLEHMAFAGGGAPGARLARRCGLPTSRATLLRLVRAASRLETTTPRVLGVDDWALRRGQTYGSILVDLEAHRPIDLLADRTAASLATWLQEHPGVEIISRDRSGAYADGGRTGAPEAMQVADRFHLLANVGDALQEVVKRHRPQLQHAARALDAAAVPDTPAIDEADHGATPQPIPQTRAEQVRQEHRTARLARYEAIIALQQEGHSQCAIGEQVGVDRKTVRRYLRAGQFPERAPAGVRRSQLGPYDPYLRARWAAGCRNARQLWREIRQQGFSGAASLVDRYVRSWRTTPGRRGRPIPQALCDGDQMLPAIRQPTRVRSPREGRWLLLHEVDNLRLEDQTYRAHLLDGCADLQAAALLANEFGDLVRKRHPTALGPWLERAEHSGLPEFRAVATGIRRDHAAVTAALSSPWSNGQTEGQITRLKCLKRQMYGRAKLDLLRQRVLRVA